MIQRNKKFILGSEQRPQFIVIEGGEGSGKTSALMALKEEIGDSIFTTREPGGSPYAELIRTAALKNPLAKSAPAETTLCLMFAARFDNTKNAIIPALTGVGARDGASAVARGKSVIADRYDASSFAYNVWAQSDGTLEEIFWNLRERLATKPDLYIFFDVDPEEGIRRANSRNQSLLQGKQYDHFDDREIAFHEKVRQGYLKFFEKVPHLVIDANRPFEEVKKNFIDEIKKRI